MYQKTKRSKTSNHEQITFDLFFEETPLEALSRHIEEIPTNPLSSEANPVVLSETVVPESIQEQPSIQEQTQIQVPKQEEVSIPEQTLSPIQEMPLESKEENASSLEDPFSVSLTIPVEEQKSQTDEPKNSNNETMNMPDEILIIVEDEEVLASDGKTELVLTEEQRLAAKESLKEYRVWEEEHLQNLDPLDVVNIESLPDDILVRHAKIDDQDAIEQLIFRYRKLVRNCTRHYYAPGLEQDDLEQEGTMGLCNAIRSYQLTKPTPFKNFAELCIKRQIITAVKTATRQKHIPLNQYTSLDKPVFEEDADRNLHDVLINEKEQTPEELLIDKENIYAIMTKMKDVLSPLESAVLMCQIEKDTYQDMATKLNRSVKSVDNAMQRVRKKLAKIMTDLKKEEGMFEDMDK